MTWAGQLVYGVLVALLEFLPLGGINPKEVADYFGAVSGPGSKRILLGGATPLLVQKLFTCAWYSMVSMSSLMTNVWCGETVWWCSE